MSRFKEYMEATKRPMRGPMGYMPSAESMRKKFDTQFPGQSKEYIDKNVETDKSFNV